jgi:alpha-beta hydrolase superfamily lysophospholipase
MAHSEHFIAAGDGVRLRLQHWTPMGQPRALVVITHGHGEHSSRYAHVAQALNAGAYAVVAHDLRGHGRSGGPRGHIPGYAQVLDDVHAVSAWARAQHAGQVCFLYGHSMGGQITLSYALDRKPEVAGVVVSAPWLRLKYMPPGWKVRLGLALSQVWPTFALDTGLDAVPMAHDTAHLGSMPELDLTHTRISARLGAEALSHGGALLAAAPAFSLPLLILHGEADSAMDPAGSRAFYERAASRDKTLKLYPGLYHEVHNETERSQVLADIRAWLDDRS